MTIISELPRINRSERINVCSILGHRLPYPQATMDDEYGKHVSRAVEEEAIALLRQKVGIDVPIYYSLSWELDKHGTVELYFIGSCYDPALDGGAGI